MFVPGRKKNEEKTLECWMSLLHKISKCKDWFTNYEITWSGENESNVILCLLLQANFVFNESFFLSAVTITINFLENPTKYN